MSRYAGSPIVESTGTRSNRPPFIFDAMKLTHTCRHELAMRISLCMTGTLPGAIGVCNKSIVACPVNLRFLLGLTGLWVGTSPHVSACWVRDSWLPNRVRLLICHRHRRWQFLYLVSTPSTATSACLHAYPGRSYPDPDHGRHDPPVSALLPVFRHVPHPA